MYSHRRVGARLSRVSRTVGDLVCGRADERLDRLFMQRRGWRECPLLPRGVRSAQAQGKITLAGLAS